MRTKPIIVALFASCSAAAPIATAQAPKAGVPVIYTTDLYHPHADPDDHYDLATLFAVPEFDIRAFVFDLGKPGANRPGTVPLEQMMRITGRKVPYARGLLTNLQRPDDRAENQPGQTQAGVKLILQTLRDAKRPVTIFTTGSLRDVAAAFNRRPDLFTEKVSRLYINVGHSTGGKEYNVNLDPHAYVRILRSGLPVYWVPCFGDGPYNSHWKFNQNDILKSVHPQLQNFFVYCLSRASASEWDPTAALTTPLPMPVKRKVWAGPRNMWCTGAFLHAAGRKGETYTFKKVPVQIDTKGVTRVTPGRQGVQLMTFHRSDPKAYANEMRQQLHQLLSQLHPAP